MLAIVLINVLVKGYNHKYFPKEAAPLGATQPPCCCEGGETGLTKRVSWQRHSNASFSPNSAPSCDTFAWPSPCPGG